MPAPVLVVNFGDKPAPLPGIAPAPVDRRFILSINLSAEESDVLPASTAAIWARRS